MVAASLSRDPSTLQRRRPTYDLRYRRIHRVIRRIAPHAALYLTRDGMRAALLYTSLDRRLRGPFLPARLTPQALPSVLDAALDQLDIALQDLCAKAKRAAWLFRHGPVFGFIQQLGDARDAWTQLISNAAPLVASLA